MAGWDSIKMVSGFLGILLGWLCSSSEVRVSAASPWVACIAPFDQSGMFSELFFGLVDGCGDLMGTIESDNPVNGMPLPRAEITCVP